MEAVADFKNEKERVLKEALAIYDKIMSNQVVQEDKGDNLLWNVVERQADVKYSEDVLRK